MSRGSPVSTGDNRVFRSGRKSITFSDMFSPNWSPRATRPARNDPHSVRRQGCLHSRVVAAMSAVLVLTLATGCAAEEPVDVPPVTEHPSAAVEPEVLPGPADGVEMTVADGLELTPE